ncbi:MAG: serine/threonine protein phosphatase [Oscillospiraceae bacterium]
MRKFSGKNQSPPRVQLRDGARHPFGVLSGYVPLGGGETRIYRAVREAVPVVDAAIMKLIRLTGGFSVACGSERAERELKEFLRTVSTGRGQRGLESFLDGYLDSMLTSGSAVGEIVLSRGGDIAAVVCGNVEDVQVREGDTPLDFQLCAVRDGVLSPLPYQELLLFTPFHPEAGSPYGVSLLRSMPYLTDILLKIFQSVGNNFERCGNVRYAVTYKPQGDLIDRSLGAERVRQIAEQWSAAMESGKSGAVRDFVALGDVDIRTIGADNQVMDSEGPVRQILEQLIAKTGIPPFMLGLTWSSTERMSSQQADLMTSEITAIRRNLTPVIERICDLWLRLHGYACGYTVIWDDINLQDQVEEAKAELYRLQAAQMDKSGENGKGGNGE